MSAQEEELELKQRLEGGHAVLQAAELRLDALVPALGSWRWEAKVRALADVARAFVRDEVPLRALVARAARRVVSEAWPKGPTRSLVEHVGALLARLDVSLTERGFPSLETLVLAVVGAPRRVSLAERDAAAAEVLDPGDQLVAQLLTLQEALSSLFGRPHARGGDVPFSLSEYDALLPTWEAGRGALAEAWGRVGRIDNTGGVERWLRRRAEVAPRASHRTTHRLGPVALAGAGFWHRHATALRRQWLEERFAPVEVREVEEEVCFRFVLARRDDGAARGASSFEQRAADTPATAREALLMLAHEVRGVGARVPLQGGVREVRAWASLADTRPSDDWRRLRDALQVVMGRTRGPALSPLSRSLEVPPRTPAAQRLADFFSGS
jgi:hypothetical protein